MFLLLFFSYLLLLPYIRSEAAIKPLKKELKTPCWSSVVEWQQMQTTTTTKQLSRKMLNYIFYSVFFSSFRPFHSKYINIMHQCLCTFKKSFGINLNFYAILNDFFYFVFSLNIFPILVNLRWEEKIKRKIMLKKIIKNPIKNSRVAFFKYILFFIKVCFSV